MFELKVAHCKNGSIVGGENLLPNGSLGSFDCFHDLKQAVVVVVVVVVVLAGVIIIIEG
jgi:hypothetical protein